MRQTVGHTFIFKLVLVFTLMFTCFLALAITYNKVFRLKNEMTSIIEKYEGINDQSLMVINNYLSASGYNTKGECNEGFSGVSSFDDTNYETYEPGEEYLYCFQEDRSVKSSNSHRKFYRVIVFYKFNLPVIGDLVTYKIKGETKTIYAGETD